MSARSRLGELAREWGVTIHECAATPSSLIAFGRRGSEPVVLKVVQSDSDEWHAGDALRAFGGDGVVRVLERTEGALLLERANPGTPLADLVRAGRDAEATGIIADVVGRMTPRAAPEQFPTVRDWARGFDRYAASGDRSIPAELVTSAHRLYVELAASQTEPRLLHGDLQHYNILYDAGRGWLAIDPKGVIGELEFELGAVLRNPNERPELFADAAIVRARVDRLTAALGLDPGRVLAWAFSQAVLSAIWSVEDGVAVNANDDPALRLARTIEPMLAATD